MKSKGNEWISAFTQEETTTDDFIQEDHLIEKLPVAIYTCDTEGRITFYNTAAANLWGRKPELGKDLWYGSWRIFDSNGLPFPIEESPMAKALREQREIDGGASAGTSGRQTHQGVAASQTDIRCKWYHDI